MNAAHRYLALSIALAAVVLALPRAGLAADDEARGRRLYRQGESLVSAGKYRQAAAVFEQGYTAAPRPGFLLNIGNCYRKLGELGRARTYYWRFLEESPRTHPERPRVHEYLQMIEQIAADGGGLDREQMNPGPVATAPGPVARSPGADEQVRKAGEPAVGVPRAVETHPAPGPAAGAVAPVRLPLAVQPTPGGSPQRRAGVAVPPTALPPTALPTPALPTPALPTHVPATHARPAAWPAQASAPPAHPPRPTVGSERRWWLWGLVGGAVAVAAGGGLWYGLRDGGGCPGTLGCLDE